METLKKRADFLGVKKGRKWITSSLILQGRPREISEAEQSHDDGEGARFGFIVTKRIGNAVKRNRARRRLREAVRIVGPDCALSDFDYVIVAREDALSRSFGDVKQDLKDAFQKVNIKGLRPEKKGRNR